MRPVCLLPVLVVFLVACGERSTSPVETVPSGIAAAAAAVVAKPEGLPADAVETMLSDEAGKPVAQGWMWRGKPIGPWRYWHDGGRSLAMSGSYRAAGVREGTWFQWWPDGSRQSEADWVDGRLHGDCEGFHPGGIIAYRGRYHHGKREGFWRIYHSNGRLAGRGHYLADQEAGLWSFWDAAGRTAGRSTGHLPGFDMPVNAWR